MRLAFCVEDDTDEEVLAVILSHLIGEEVVAAGGPYRFRRGGWTNALKLAPAIAWDASVKGLDGAVFGIDCDDGEPHDSTHDSAPHPTCRLCELRRTANVAPAQRAPRPGLTSLRFFFAVPVRTLETWLLLLRGHPFVGPPEAVGRDPAGRRELKFWLYGTHAPARDRMRDVAAEVLSGVNGAVIDRVIRTSDSFRYLAEQAGGS